MGRACRRRPGISDASGGGVRNVPITSSKRLRSVCRKMALAGQIRRDTGSASQFHLGSKAYVSRWRIRSRRFMLWSATIARRAPGRTDDTEVAGSGQRAADDVEGGAEVGALVDLLAGAGPVDGVAGGADEG